MFISHRQFFIDFKEYIQDNYKLKQQGKAHPEPHLWAEYIGLLDIFQNEEMSKFVSYRLQGHAASHLFY